MNRFHLLVFNNSPCCTLRSRNQASLKSKIKVEFSLKLNSINKVVCCPEKVYLNKHNFGENDKWWLFDGRTNDFWYFYFLLSLIKFWIVIIQWLTRVWNMLCHRSLSILPLIRQNLRKCPSFLCYASSYNGGEKRGFLTTEKAKHCFWLNKP